MDLDFIVRYLANEVSNEDRNSIEKWIDADSENFRKVAEYKKIWEASSFVGTFDEIDKKQDWEIIKDKFKPRYRMHAEHIPAWKYLTRGVAILLVAVGLVYGLYYITSLAKNPNQIVTEATDQIKTITLPDGTEVTLNKNSFISYTSDYNIKNRNIELEGEAYFRVNKNSIYPVIIQTVNSTIRVVGTVFNVREDTISVKVTVLSGKVLFYETLDKENKVELKKNEAASFYLASKKIIYGLNDDLNVLTWKTGKFEFVKTPTVEALNTIAGYFNKRLVLQANVQDSITGVFDNQPLYEILKEIELTTSLKIDNVEDLIIIRK